MDAAPDITYVLDDIDRILAEMAVSADDLMDAVRYAGCSVTRFGVQGRKRDVIKRRAPKLGRF